MAGHKDSFAAKLRKAAKTFNDTFGYADLSNAADLRSSAEEKKMKTALRDFFKRKEVIRIAPGVMRYVGRTKDAANVEKRRVMWQILNFRRTVTVEDLVGMAAGVAESYVLEWLRMLVRQEVVRKIEPANPTLPCRWQLIKDLAEMPEDEAQKKKYREIRRKKKESLNKAFDRIQAGVDEVRVLLEDI